MAEDFDNHPRIFDGGDDLQGAAAVGAAFHGRRNSLGSSYDSAHK